MKKKTYIFLIMCFKAQGGGLKALAEMSAKNVSFFLAGSPNGYAANYLCSKRAFRQTTWVSHRKNIFLADMSANVGSNPKKMHSYWTYSLRGRKKKRKKKFIIF